MGLLQKLHAGKIVIGMQNFSGNEAMVEILGYCGFDFVQIDMEHSPATFETVGKLIRAADSAGIIPLVRVLTNNPYDIMKSLDLGAAGVRIPHIDTKEQALKAVQSAKYPPDGFRGCCNSVRSTKYGAEDWNINWRRSNQNNLIIPLIESVEGVENFDGILEVDGIDIISIGSRDLAQSFNLPEADFTHPDIKKEVLKLADKAKKKGKFLMTTASPRYDVEYLRELYELGFRAFSFGTDLRMFTKFCTGLITDIRKEFNY